MLTWVQTRTRSHVFKEQRNTQRHVSADNDPHTLRKQHQVRKNVCVQSALFLILSGIWWISSNGFKLASAVAAPASVPASASRSVVSRVFTGGIKRVDLHQPEQSAFYWIWLIACRPAGARCRFNAVVNHWSKDTHCRRWNTSASWCKCHWCYGGTIIWRIGTWKISELIGH